MDVPVSIRGIYATALTRRLNETATVVAPSTPIQDRFETEFEMGEPRVRIRSSRDRVGVELSGDPDSVASVTNQLETVARDGFSWPDPVPSGAVVDAVVVGDSGGGAIVDLGATDGYLPYDVVDDYIDTGDEIRVQVHDPEPPWVSHRHGVRPTIEVSGVIVSLVKGVDALVAGTPEDGADLGRTTELLDVEVPDDWGVRWESPATECRFEALSAALASVVDRANALDATLETGGGGDPPTVVGEPMATQWVRFGREGRFRLDDDRAAVVSTLPGHHRIKAGGGDASPAVDFAEGLGATVDAFPWRVVTDQFGPDVGDSVRIEHGKPDGRAYDLGPGDITDRDPDAERVEVTRTLQSAGTYDGLDVEKARGDVAVTTFQEGRWWYPTTYRSADGELRGTYLNVNTPIEVFPDAVTYVDLHIDVVKWPDGSVAIVDRDELRDAVDAGHVSSSLAEQAVSVAETVESAFESN